MRAICYTILALIFFEFFKVKTSSLVITTEDKLYAGSFVAISVGFVTAAIILCIFGL